MTFTLIRAAIATLIHDTSTATDTILKTFVNRAYQEILGHGPFAFQMKEGSLTTVASQLEYDLASDVNFILAMRQTTSPQKLMPISFRDFLEWQPNPTATGNPQWYVTVEPDSSSAVKQVWLYPIPSAVMTVAYWYTKTSSDLSADGDTPTLPTPWHWLLVTGGYIQALNWQNAFEQAALINQTEYQPGIARLIREDRRRPDYLTMMKSQFPTRRQLFPLPSAYPNV